MTWQPIDTVPPLEDVLLSDGTHITVGKTIAGPHCPYWIAVVDGENATRGKAMVPWVLQWRHYSMATITIKTRQTYASAAIAGSSMRMSLFWSLR